MRAQFVIEHRPGDFLECLAAAFGPHNEEVLANSAFAKKSPSSARDMEYAGSRPGYVIMAWTAERRVTIYVESLSGNLRGSADAVWDLTSQASANLKPKLRSVVLFDEDANDEILTGRVGLIANVRRPELWLTFLVGVLSSIWLGVALALFDATGDLVLGAIPAIGAAILGLGILFFDSASRKLVWR